MLSFMRAVFQGQATVFIMFFKHTSGCGGEGLVFEVVTHFMAGAWV